LILLWAKPFISGIDKDIMDKIRILFRIGYIYHKAGFDTLWAKPFITGIDKDIMDKIRILFRIGYIYHKAGFDTFMGKATYFTD
jgi:hypothetical protein